jgi:hypothetical protein
MTLGEDGPAASRSAKSVIALALSIAALFVSPLLAFAQYVAAMLLGMVTSEPSNPAYAGVAFFCVFAGIAALAFALPVASLILSRRARRDIQRSDGAMSGMPLAVTAQVIAVIVIVLLLLFETFVVLSFAGICSLDGWSSAN